MLFSRFTLIAAQQAISAFLSNISTIKELVLIAAAIFGVYKIMHEIGNQRKMLVENQRMKEREDLRFKLNKFFGPMRALRTESRILYEHFAISEKTELKKRKGKATGFRTLIHLSESLPLKEPDRAILEQILEIEKKELNLIEEEGWTITNPQLTELLGKFATHIRTLSLAYNNKLKGYREI